MILFLPCGFIELGADGRIAGEQRLPLVQRLGTHLADVIDAHQPGGMAALGFGQFCAVVGVGDDGVGGVGAGGAGDTGHGAQGAVEFRNEAIGHRNGAGGEGARLVQHCTGLAPRCFASGQRRMHQTVLYGITLRQPRIPSGFAGNLVVTSLFCC